MVTIKHGSTLLLALAFAMPASAQTRPASAEPSAAAQPAKEESRRTHPEFDRRQVVPFLDATYVGFGLASRVDDRRPTAATGTTAVEADIVPNFVVRQTFFDVIGAEEGNRLRGGRSEWRFATSIVAVPMVKLRLLVNEPSAPVRTPSYMPKGTFQFFLFKPRERAVDLIGFQATLGHHSNGQDGCLFANQRRDVAINECLPVAPADRSYIEPNRINGSFSTNYLQFGARYRRVGLEPDQGTGERLSNRDATIGVELELNPVEFLGGAGIDEELRSRYGGTRVSVLGGVARKNFGFGSRVICNRLEAKGFLKFIIGHGENVPGVAASIEGQCLFRDTNWGFFTRVYGGQDFYNLAFQDSVRRLQVGLTYSQEGFLRFRTK